MGEMELRDTDLESVAGGKGRGSAAPQTQVVERTRFIRVPVFVPVYVEKPKLPPPKKKMDN